MIEVAKVLPERGYDAWGSGDYHAPRGDRLHNGIDYQCDVCESVLTPIAGKVTKLGYPYSDDLSYRYVEVTDDNGYRHRVFYIRPTCAVGDVVRRCYQIGVSQDISVRYSEPGREMKNHVHYEIIDPSGNFIDPRTFWKNHA